MTPVQSQTKFTIRRLDDEDATRLARLAELDSRAVPHAPAIGAEVDGSLIAAVSLADGEAVADPFRRTVEALDLLQARAKQLGSPPKRRRRRRPRRSRAALAGSPPGAGGRLIQLG